MNRHLYKQATAKDLGIVRAAVFGIWLIIIAFSPFTSYAYLPAEVFEPYGIFRLVFMNSDGLFTRFILTENFLFFLKTALLAGCFLCMTGTKRFKWVAIPTVGLLYLADGITKGFSGYVNHAELVVLYAAFILAIFSLADGFSLFKPGASQKKVNQTYSIPILAVAFTLCATYTFIAVHRLLYGGMAQFFNHALEVHLLVNSFNYSKYGFDWGLAVASSENLMILFKSGFFAVTLFELLSLFILVNKPFRYLWLGVMIPFHILSLLTMNIFFWENLVLIGVLFLVVPFSGRALAR